MSLEQVVLDLTVAVKELTATIKGAKVDAPTKTTAVAAKKIAAPVAEAEVDPFAGAAEAEITFESLSDVLKTHAKALGTKTTIALIVKHGADAVVPKINTIPTANYKACFDEATADLKKVKKA